MTKTERLINILTKIQNETHNQTRDILSAGGLIKETIDLFRHLERSTKDLTNLKEAVAVFYGLDKESPFYDNKKVLADMMKGYKI